MNMMPRDAVDVRAALKALPPLIKGYLRVGAYVGDGAVIDHQFGTTDVFVIMPVEAIKARYIAGWGGATLAGTPEMIVDGLIELANAGIDGVVLSWVDYEAELQEFATSVLPLIEQAGLRKPRPPTPTDLPTPTAP